MAPGLIKRTRSALRAAVRSFAGYDAAGGSGRWPHSAALWAQNAQSLAARKVMNPRINYLVANSPHGAAFVESWVNALCGDGPSIRASHPDADVRQRLQDEFAEWCLHCSSEGDGIDLGGMLETMTRSVVQSGEAVTRFEISDDARLRLNLLNPDQLDSSRTMPGMDASGTAPNIVSGVEFDERGRRLAYWLLPDAPDAPGGSVSEPQRIDAADVAHVFVRKFPGQVRGLSWLTPIATRLVELDQLEDAALVKAKVSALMTFFLTDSDGSLGVFDGITGGTGFDPATLQMQPGFVNALPPNVDIKSPPITDMVSLAEVLRHFLHSIAAGGGLTYERISSDMSQVNYSSARLAEAQFQRKVKAFQSNLLVAQFLLPIWRRWVMLQILSGRLYAPDFDANPLAYLNAKFLFSGMPNIDPLKQSKADALDLASRTKSRAEIVAANGRDIDDVDQEIDNDHLYVSDDAQAKALLAQPEEVSSNA